MGHRTGSFPPANIQPSNNFQSPAWNVQDPAATGQPKLRHPLLRRIVRGQALSPRLPVLAQGGLIIPLRLISRAGSVSNRLRRIDRFHVARVRVVKHALILKRLP